MVTKLRRLAYSFPSIYLLLVGLLVFLYKVVELPLLIGSCEPWSTTCIEPAWLLFGTLSTAGMYAFGPVNAYVLATPLKDSAEVVSLMAVVMVSTAFFSLLGAGIEKINSAINAYIYSGDNQENSNNHV